MTRAGPHPRPSAVWAMGAAFAAIYLIWGSTYLAIAVAVRTIPPLLMIGVRCLVAGGVLYAWSRVRGAPAPGRAAWMHAAVVGALLFVGGQGALAWAEQRVASGVAALLVATIPMFVVLLGWRGGAVAGGRPPQRPSAPVAAGLLLGLGGVALTVGGGDGGRAVDGVGAGVLLLAALAWAAGSLQAGDGADPWPDRRAATQLIAGGSLLMACSLLVGELEGFDVRAVDPRSALALAYLTVFGTLVAFSAWAWLLARTHPATVASHAYVNPAVAVVLGATLGGEAVTSRTLWGAGMIVLAVAVTVPARGRPVPGKWLARSPSPTPEPCPTIR